LLDFVVGEFVGENEPDSARLAFGRNQVSVSDFGLFATVEAEGRNVQRFTVGAQNRATTFVKPFGRDADGTRRGTTGFEPPLIHAHAIGDDGFFG